MPDTVVFDIETHGASNRFSMSPAEFFRVGGVARGSRYGEIRDYGTMVLELADADLVAGHNITSFDIPALGLDVLQLAHDRRIFDTMVADSLVDPPESDLQPARAMREKYALDPACARYGVSGKSGDLKRAALANGGFGSIPTDDPHHLAYLRADVRAARDLGDAIRMSHAFPGDYLWREHRVAALAANMTREGVCVDRELLAERVAEGESRQRELIDWLVSTHGIPTTLPNGKPAKSPQASKAGKEALVQAFESVGVSSSELPATPTGLPSFAAEGLEQVAERFPAARELCEAVAALVGVRSVYSTASKWVHADGRVHPSVEMFQASGRWSITKPGMTVFGKRGGRVVERDIFVAAPGNVLLSADLSQVDARAVAAHSGDLAYIDLFAPGKDSHILTAYLVWGEATVEASDASRKYYRDKVKAITHGTTYGMGVPKLALSAGVDESEAQRVVDTLRENFPGVERWKHEVRERAEAGEMLDNGWGRLMRPNPERAWTQGPALMGQGTARDVLMEGIAVRASLELQGMLRAVVHDEVVLECEASIAQDVRRELVEALTFEWCPEWMDVPVQFTADCSEPATRWSGCY